MEDPISVNDIIEHIAKATLAWADFWHPPTEKERWEGRNVRTEIDWKNGDLMAIGLLAAESLRASITTEKIMKIASTRLNLGKKA